MDNGKAAIIAAVIGAFATIIASVISVTLKSENTALQQQNSALQQQNEALVEESKEGATETDNLVAGLQAEISTLNKRISQLEAEKEQLTAEHSATVDELNATIADLESRLGTGNSSARETVVVDNPHRSDTPDVWLSDLDYFDKCGSWEVGEATKDNRGNTHSHSINPKYSQSEARYMLYNLDGNYSFISGYAFLKYDQRSEVGKWAFSIYGDDELLWQGTMERGVEPLSFDNDIKGVQKLKIIIEGDYDPYVSFGEVGLWK